ncbi:MAG: SUMF1/EgtB/PvdO family nonheme iron enzyme [Planctomycetes bacterium]|nr:SUMF1/EgtB/PvdO family nonheme iron enzyme [Planctomycetota bacterium]MBI3848608.1 SUMF1/EgtB/PvdO family nonheme iron enzyme [Planctomycetota bacterium]
MSEGNTDRDPPSPLDDSLDVVENLIATCVERIGREGRTAVDAVCREHPSHADEIRSAIRSLADAGLLEPADPNEPATFPERLGDFRLIRRIGGGGMGVVYLADQESLGRRVALKLIRPEHLYFPGARERFRREVESVARLQHPGIVRIHTVGETDGIPYFAMEWIDGCTLSTVLEKLGGQSPERLTAADLAAVVGDPPPASLARGTWTEACFRIVRDVALALHHAHERGVIHRDVKPSNVAITRSGQVVLLDFGLARARGVQKMTKTGSEMGSLPYMSPEQVRGDDASVDARTDVYSLGVTLYELLTLKAPYLSETTEVTRRLILDGQPESVRAHNRSVPRDAETVCLEAMERDVTRRYVSANDFARDVDNVLERRPIEARRPGAALRARRWTQRHPLATIAVLLLLVLAAGSIAFGVHERSSSLAIRRLSDLQLLRYYQQEAESFWPPDPAKLAAIDRWLEKADALAARRSFHSGELERLRAEAKPYTEEMKREDQRPARERFDNLVGEEQRLRDLMSTSPTISAADQGELEAIALHKRRAEVEMAERRTWTFESPEDQWRHDLLTDLMREMDSFVSLITDVRSLRATATVIEKRTRIDCAAKWAETIADIAASETYSHLVMRPQLGLIPLWKNPGSGLWEFLHVQSGEAPMPDPTATDPGRLRVEADTGIVLVLLPGGTFRMGAESAPKDGPRAGPNVDPFAIPSEQPVHPVTLAPFFLSKYEFTRAQWRRIGPRAEDPVSAALHPTKPICVSWEQAAAAFARTGLDLPTEAQWEYACRAGTSTVFSTGDDVASLEGYANIGDLCYAEDLLGSMPRIDPMFSMLRDGFALDAPVGSLLPNRFGVYDMHGNVGELCRDWMIYRGYRTMVPREGDGLLFMSREGRSRVVRGGRWDMAAVAARSAARSGQGPGQVAPDVGARASRSISP